MLHAARNSQQELHNFGMLALQAAGLDANDPTHSLQIEINHEVLALQAAGLGDQLGLTDNGDLPYPYAAMLDPTGTSGQTAFDFVGTGHAVGENREEYDYILINNIDTHTDCKQSCLARSDVAHGLVGYGWRATNKICKCIYDAGVSYPNTAPLGGGLADGHNPQGTGRMTVLESAYNHYLGHYETYYQTYERVYDL